jgi:putative SOS response-associated peptidase YedK
MVFPIRTTVTTTTTIAKEELMCGRFTISEVPDELADQCCLIDSVPIEPRYNIAPSQMVPVIAFGSSDGSGACILKPGEGGRPSGRILIHLKWGLVPGWAKDPSIGNRMINARAETVAEKPSYRSAFKRRRCLMLADGFFEWKKQGGSKQPYHIRMQDRSLFAFAGLWEHWSGGDGSIIQSCVLITTTPNELVKEIHDRMPVILPRDRYDAWLDPANQDKDTLKSMLKPHPADDMTAYPVSTRVNNPANDTRDLIESQDMFH